MRLSQLRKNRDTTIWNIKAVTCLVFSLSRFPCLYPCVHLASRLPAPVKPRPVEPLRLFFIYRLSLSLLARLSHRDRPLRMCGVKREEGEDGGGRGGGPGTPMAAKGSPERGAVGCTNRSARTGEALVWKRDSWGLVCRGEGGYGGCRVRARGGGGVRISRKAGGGSRWSLEVSNFGLRSHCSLTPLGLQEERAPSDLPCLSSSLPHYQGHAPGALSQDPRRTSRRRQEV